MIIRLVSLFIAVLTFSGCQALKRETSPPAFAEPILEIKHVDKASAIKGDILYALLAAELAGRRGDYPLALKLYLQVLDKVPDPRVAERAARIALYLKQYDKAAEAVKRWLQQAPDSPDAHELALILALRQGETDAAAAHFIRLLTLTPPSRRTDVLMEILRFMDHSVDRKVAAAVMAQVSRHFADSPEVLYAHAMLALRQGDVREALAQVSRAVKLQPESTRLRLLQSQLLTRLGESDKARRILRDLVREHPDDLQLRLLYAQLLLKLKDFDAAEAELKRILKRDPDHPDALYAYALVNLQQGRDKVAEKTLRRLLRQPKWRTEAYYYLGRIALRNHRYQEALAWFDKVEGDKLGFDARINAVMALAKLKRIDEALRRIEVLYDRYPNFRLQLHLLKAEILTQAHGLQAAFDALTQALADFPAHPDLLYARALVAEQMGKPHQVIADLRAALEKKPDDPNLLNALGYTLLEYQGPLDEARTYLEKAIRLKPDDPAILDSYGWLQYRLGHYSQALEYLQRAYAANPDPEIAYHLGEVYWALGQRDQARKVWRKALAEAGDDPRVAKFRKRVADRLAP